MQFEKQGKWARVLAGLGLLALLALGLPFLRSRWAINQAGLEAMAVCLGREEFSAMDGSPAFFRGITAGCLGLEKQAQVAYREAVSAPHARIAVIRAARPLDIELAALASAIHSDQAQAHFWLGEALKAEEDVTMAILAYEAGLQIDPTNGEEWDNVGRLYEVKGDWEKAVRAFDLACHYVDQGKNGCLNAARLYLVRGMYEEAIARYKDALVQLPGYAPALRGLAEALIALGRSEEAISYLETLAARGDAGAQTLLEQLQMP